MPPNDQNTVSVLGAAEAIGEATLRIVAAPLAVLSPNGVIRKVNSEMESMLGLNHGQLEGRSLGDVFVVEPDAFTTAIENGLRWEIAADTCEMKRAVRLRLEPAIDNDGNVLAWMASATPSDNDDEALHRIEEHVDVLTGLPTRQIVRLRLERAIAAVQPGAHHVTVLCIDIDGFDSVNEEYGRAVGDLVLIETARRIGRSVRGSNVIGRMMEDAFLVVIPDLVTTDQVVAVAARLIATLSRPFVTPGASDPIMISASVGIAMSPDNGNDADALIGFAQAAVDHAKRTGSGTYQFYSLETGSKGRERRSRVSKLNRAIEDDQMMLHYQPKVSLASREIVAAEALIRWQDPNSGLIMPTEFVSLAEDAGLIDPLGRVVMTTACRAVAEWHAAGLPFLRLAVNVSAREVARRSFYDDLRAIIAEHNVDPEALELEITESAIMDNAEEVVQSLRKIRALGIHLTADDFGTGYASLSHLRHLPLDGIKIDTTFVSDIDAPGSDGGLAAAVIAIGHSLGMNVVAEGVETEHQLNFLRWRDCDEIQGYLVSAPLPNEDFVAMVRKGRAI